MNTSDILNFTADLIKFKSYSGQEQEIISFLKDKFASWGWPTELVEVEENRFNLLVSFCKPEIIFTTHVDVVPGNESLFSPTIKDGVITGRGACDTKGIISTMVAVIKDLLDSGEKNFGLLLVVGEEIDGSGAKAAARRLVDRGIRWLVNGEPTEGRIMLAHKGVLGVTISTEGKACHSGYPELGDDANLKLINVLKKLSETRWPVSSNLGKTTLNIGQIKAGVAGNIISPRAEANLAFRTVADNQELLQMVREVVGDAAKIKVTYSAPAVNMADVPGLPSGVAAYCTDVPNFAPLGAKAILYGPGNIHFAHTDYESISASDIEDARKGYRLIFHHLKNELQK
jgi:acetylornithine deacetylase